MSLPELTASTTEEVPSHKQDDVSQSAGGSRGTQGGSREYGTGAAPPAETSRDAASLLGITDSNIEDTPLLSPLGITASTAEEKPCRHACGIFHDHHSGTTASTVEDTSSSPPPELTAATAGDSPSSKQVDISLGAHVSCGDQGSQEIGAGSTPLGGTPEDATAPLSGITASNAEDTSMLSLPEVISSTAEKKTCRHACGILQRHHSGTTSSAAGDSPLSPPPELAASTAEDAPSYKQDDVSLTVNKSRRTQIVRREGSGALAAPLDGTPGDARAPWFGITVSNTEDLSSPSLPEVTANNGEEKPWWHAFGILHRHESTVEDAPLLPPSELTVSTAEGAPSSKDDVSQSTGGSHGTQGENIEYGKGLARPARTLGDLVAPLSGIMASNTEDASSPSLLRVTASTDEEKPSRHACGILHRHHSGTTVSTAEDTSLSTPPELAVSTVGDAPSYRQACGILRRHHERERRTAEDALSYRQACSILRRHHHRERRHPSGPVASHHHV